MRHVNHGLDEFEEARTQFNASMRLAQTPVRLYPLEETEEADGDAANETLNAYPRPEVAVKEEGFIKVSPELLRNVDYAVVGLGGFVLCLSAWVTSNTMIALAPSRWGLIYADGLFWELVWAVGFIALLWWRFGARWLILSVLLVSVLGLVPFDQVNGETWIQHAVWYVLFITGLARAITVARPKTWMPPS